MKLAASNPFKSTLKGSSSSPFLGSKKKERSVDAPIKKKRPIADVLEVEPRDYPVAVARRPVIQGLSGMAPLPDGMTCEVMLSEDDSLDNEVRYKNMRTNDNVMAQPTELATQVSRKKVRGLTTMFGQRADIILNLLEDDSQTDGALTLIQRTLLQTMVDVLPVVERSVRTSRGKRGVYQLNQCISQIRELTTDIQSLRDRGQLGASVVERTLRPAYLDLAAQISMAITEIGNSAKMYMTKEDHVTFRTEVLVPMTRTLADFVQGQYAEVKEGVTAGLS